MSGWKFQEEYWKDSLPWVSVLENIKRKPDKPDLSKVFINHPIHHAFVISLVGEAPTWEVFMNLVHSWPKLALPFGRWVQNQNMEISSVDVTLHLMMNTLVMEDQFLTNLGICGKNPTDPSSEEKDKKPHQTREIV